MEIGVRPHQTTIALPVYTGYLSLYTGSLPICTGHRHVTLVIAGLYWSLPFLWSLVSFSWPPANCTGHYRFILANASVYWPLPVNTGRFQLLLVASRFSWSLSVYPGHLPVYWSPPVCTANNARQRPKLAVTDSVSPRYHPRGGRRACWGWPA